MARSGKKSGWRPTQQRQSFANSIRVRRLELRRHTPTDVLEPRDRVGESIRWFSAPGELPPIGRLRLLWCATNRPTPVTRSGLLLEIRTAFLGGALRRRRARRRWRPPHGVGAWLGAEDRSPVAGGGSRQFVAVGHSEQCHLVEDLAPELHLYPLPFHASTPHVSTEDRFVSVDRIFHHAALAVA